MLAWIETTLATIDMVKNLCPESKIQSVYTFSSNRWNGAPNAYSNVPSNGEHPAPLTKDYHPLSWPTTLAEPKTMEINHLEDWRADGIRPCRSWVVAGRNTEEHTVLKVTVPIHSFTVCALRPGTRMAKTGKHRPSPTLNRCFPTLALWLLWAR